MFGRLAFGFASVLAFYVPTCGVPVRPTTPIPAEPVTSLWSAPADLQTRDLLNGPWGLANAPDAGDVYTLEAVKHHGVNPGLTVRDSRGRKWSVKQPLPDALGAEGPVEVTVSRLLSAVGYHQPPVYFMASFTLRDDWGTHTEVGGRFRLTEKSLQDTGTWSWQENPFVGTRPYGGLLSILLMLNSSDLKNSNNSLYLHRSGNRQQRWYVVRDLGASLGTTGRWAPRKNDVSAFEGSRFIVGMRGGFVDFAYSGWHQELVRQQLTPGDVHWGAGLLAQLTDRQWRDAFRAGGYPETTAQRFIAKLRRNVDDGLRVGRTPDSSAQGR